jgi:hypothetical protein
MVGNLLVALVLISGELDVQANAILETRAGLAPIIAGQESTAFVTEIVSPVGMFEYRDPALTFQVDYSPRIYWQHPNALDNWSPLVLHTANLLLNAKTTRRLTLIGSATGSIGNPDYIELQRLLNAVQVPQIVKIASVTGHLGARVALTPRWELDLDGQLLYWRSLGGAIDMSTGVATVTEQRAATEQATALYRLNPRHSLGFGAALSEASYNGGSLDIYTIGPTATWNVHLTQRDDLKVTFGITYVRAVGDSIGSTMPLFGSSGQAASPVGAFDLVSRVARSDEFFILVNASGGVDYYVDPVLATAVPRARTNAGITAIMAPNWAATLRGDFSTALRTTAFALPVAATATTPASGPIYPDETVVSLSCAVRRRITPAAFAEIGGLWAERAPAFVTPGFEFHQRQLWVFAQLAWTSHPILQTGPQPIH